MWREPRDAVATEARKEDGGGRQNQERNGPENRCMNRRTSSVKWLVVCEQWAEIVRTMSDEDVAVRATLAAACARRIRVVRSGRAGDECRQNDRRGQIQCRRAFGLRALFYKSAWSRLSRGGAVLPTWSCCAKLAASLVLPGF